MLKWASWQARESNRSAAAGEEPALREVLGGESCRFPLLWLMALEGDAWSVLRILCDVGCSCNKQHPFAWPKGQDHTGVTRTRFNGAKWEMSQGSLE